MFASLAQMYQPDFALVLMVAEMPDVLVTLPAAKALAKLSELPLSTKLNVGATLALTAIWSLVMVRTATVAVSLPAVMVGWYSLAVAFVTAVALVRSTQ